MSNELVRTILEILNMRVLHNKKNGRHSGLMVSVLDSRARGSGLNPCQGHCVEFLGKTLYSHEASLHPGV